MGARINPFIIYFLIYCFLLFLQQQQQQQLPTKNHYDSFSRSTTTTDKTTTTTTTANTTIITIADEFILSFVQAKEKELCITKRNDEDDIDNTLIGQFVSSFVKVIDPKVLKSTTILKLMGLYCSKFSIIATTQHVI